MSTDRHGLPPDTSLPSEIELGQAFVLGKMAGRSADRNVASCTFGTDRPELRAAWLHGFNEGQAAKQAPAQHAEATKPTSQGSFLEQIMPPEHDVFDFAGSPTLDPIELERAQEAGR